MTAFGAAVSRPSALDSPATCSAAQFGAASQKLFNRSITTVSLAAVEVDLARLLALEWELYAVSLSG